MQRIRESGEHTLYLVKNSKGKSSLVQMAGFFSVEDEGSWYYGDPERPTVKVLYTDSSWARYEIALSDFSEQIGSQLSNPKNKQE